MMIAYTVGEGVGRLGCISFGCCYGRILDQSNPFLRKLFKRWTFVFEGETKKIAYAHHYDSLPVIPVQRLTVIIFTASAVVGCYFFLKGYAGAVLAGLTVTTQGWRFMSEYLRADYRGKGKITVYQGMAAASIPYVFFLIAFMSPSVRVSPDIMRGLQALWTPGVIIFLELLWWAVFLYTGRSNVTESQIAVYVLRDKI
jgi:prolipoprotein diacylglyceryltransferase